MGFQWDLTNQNGFFLVCIFMFCISVGMPSVDNGKNYGGVNQDALSTRQLSKP